MMIETERIKKIFRKIPPEVISPCQPIADGVKGKPVIPITASKGITVNFLPLAENKNKTDPLKIKAKVQARVAI